MNMKEHILAALKEQLQSWEDLLTTLDESKITGKRIDQNWCIQDVIAHLWGWQQISIARMEAARLNQEPRFPDWLAELPGDWEENVDQTNSWFFRTCHDKPWKEVHHDWLNGYLHLLEVGGSIFERDLLDGDKYPWLNGFSAAIVLVASYDHHQEHLEKLNSWLEEQDVLKNV